MGPPWLRAPVMASPADCAPRRARSSACWPAWDALSAGGAPQSATPQRRATLSTLKTERVGDYERVDCADCVSAKSWG